MRLPQNLTRQQPTQVRHQPPAPNHAQNQTQAAQHTPTHTRMSLPEGVRPGSDQPYAQSSWINSPKFSHEEQRNLKGTSDHLKQKYAEAKENFRNHATVENEIKMQEASEHVNTFHTSGFRGLGETPGSYNRYTDGLNARHKVVENRRSLRDDVRASNAPHNVKRGTQHDYNLAKTHLKNYKEQHGSKLNHEKEVRQQTAHIQEPAGPAPRPRTPETPALGPHDYSDNIPPLSLDRRPSTSSSSSSSSGFSASDFPPGVKPSTSDNYRSGPSSERPILPAHEQLNHLKDQHGSTKGAYYGIKHDGTQSRADIHNARADYLGAKDNLDTFRKENKGVLKEETAQQGRFNKLEKEFGHAPLGGLPPPESPFAQRPAPTPVRPGTPSIPIGPQEFDRLSSLPGFNPTGPGGFSPNYPAFTSMDTQGNRQIHSGPEALQNLPHQMMGQPMRMQSDAQGRVLHPLPPTPNEPGRGSGLTGSAPRSSGGPNGPSEKAIGKRTETASTAQDSPLSAQGSSSRPHAGMSWEQLNTQMRSSENPRERASLRAEIEQRIQSGSAL